MATYGSIRYSGIEDAGVAGGGVESYADVNALPASPTVGDLALITGTNKLYVYDGTSWFNIAIVNQAPTAITGNEASYALAIDGTPTVVTLVSTDPEGFPLTWSSSVSGDTQVGTVTNADNVFTITPSADLADEGTLSITFSVTDGTNTENSTSTFTLAFVSALWDETVLSIGTNSTNSLDNSTFIDRSTNAHSITANGNTKQTAFHPYLDNWSVEFDGNGDRLTVPDSDDFDFGTGDFTIELWAFFNTVSVRQALVSNYLSSPSGFALQLGTTPSNSDKLNFGWGDTNLVSSASLSWSTGTWYHLAVARSGTSIKLFRDGLEVASTTNSTNLSNSTALLTVGALATLNIQPMNGYISDLRIVKGTAVYTSAFTPPTEKLTAISGTSLLTCQSNRFIDNSTNAHTITANGDAKVSAYNPFGQDSEYSVTGNKGATLFDGSGDYLKTASESAFNLYNTNFTIEGWFYATAPAGNEHIWSSYIDTNNRESLYFSNSTTLNWWVNGSTRISATVSANHWHHFAIVNNSGTTKFYLDGISQGTWSSTYTDGSRLVWVGTYNNAAVASDSFTGLISDIRFSNGTAVYTSDFTPPTAPVGNTNASLYLPMDNAGIFDKTGNNTLTLAGNTSTSTTQTKFADTAIYFDGTGDYLTGFGDMTAMGSGDFTWEFWVYFNAFGTYTGLIDSRLSNGTGTNAGLLYVNGTTLTYWSGGSQKIAGSTLSTGQWYHVAAVRNSGTVTLYLNGTSEGSASDSIAMTTPILRIGDTFDNYPLNGYIENLQILRGVAKYTANFTPPTQEQGRTYQEES